MDGTVTRIKEEVHDPWGVRTAITSHPFVTAGVAAGVGVGAWKLFSGRTSDRPEAPTRLEYWAGKLLDGGLHVLKPLALAHLENLLSAFAPAEADAGPDPAAAGA